MEVGPVGKRNNRRLEKELSPETRSLVKIDLEEKNLSDKIFNPLIF